MRLRIANNSVLSGLIPRGRFAYNGIMSAQCMTIPDFEATMIVSVGLSSAAAKLSSTGLLFGFVVHTSPADTGRCHYPQE
jgi:hypothetical protein